MNQTTVVKEFFYKEGRRAGKITISQHGGGKFLWEALGNGGECNTAQEAEDTAKMYVRGELERPE
jgi:hypothetical protein